MDYYFSLNLCYALKAIRMIENRVLISVWGGLLLCTLFSVLMAEGADFSDTSVVLVCAIVSLKSRLVIDYLMGLALAHPRLRNVMVGYFYIIPFLIAVGAIFPSWIVAATSLN